MRLFKTVTGLRTYLVSVRGNQIIALVPTMGALHQGHISLIRRAVSEADIVVVSIFVNPLQFSPNEDLAQYPRQLEKDIEVCQRLGVKVIFAPSSEEMGAKSSGDTIQVSPPDVMLSSLCAPFRPGHFQGVATIVTKLFNIVNPNVAYFGEKDPQQLAIIRRLVQDLNLPIVIKGCPIVRETSGLAFSSRNQYLSEVEKQQAIALYQSLQLAKQRFTTGERTSQVLIDLVKEKLTLSAGLMVQYVECVNPQTLTPLNIIEEAGLLAIAAYVGSTRLIDNVILSVRKPIIAIDGPAGAGKSTVTRQVADALNFTYLDTGAMYRAIAWLILQSGISVTDESSIAELVSQANLKFIPSDDEKPPQVFINGTNVTDVIRTPEITALVSQVSAQRAVREQLVAYQQKLGRIGGIVAEGRDIGTNVFPDAEVKIFLTASVQERARRRLIDFQAQGRDNMDLQQLEKEIEQRDYQDSHRSLAPLRKAINAIEINTDGLKIEEVIDKIIQVCITEVPVLSTLLS